MRNVEIMSIIACMDLDAYLTMINLLAIVMKFQPLLLHMQDIIVSTLQLSFVLVLAQGNIPFAHHMVLAEEKLG